MKSNIKKIMTSQNLTVSDLSKRTGISRTTITPLYKGDMLPTKTRIDTLIRISKALNVTLSDLFFEENYKVSLTKEGIKIDEYYDFDSFYTDLLPYYLFPIDVHTEVGDFTSLITVEPVVSISQEDDMVPLWEIEGKALRSSTLLNKNHSADELHKASHPFSMSSLAAEIRREIRKINPKFNFFELRCFFVSKMEFTELQNRKSNIAKNIVDKFPHLLFCGSNNCIKFINGKGYLDISINLINKFKQYMPIPEETGMTVNWYVTEPSMEIRTLNLNDANNDLRHPEAKEIMTKTPLYGFDKLTLGSFLTLNENIWASKK